MGWPQHEEEPATSAFGACMAALCACCCLRPASVHPDRAEAAAMRQSGDLVLAHHVMEMTALTSGAEGRAAGKAAEGGLWRQSSLVLGGSKVAAPLSRSVSGPAQHQAWPTAADGLVSILPLRCVCSSALNIDVLLRAAAPIAA